MNPEPRYVIDNNVLVSAVLFSRSIPAQAVKAALRNGVILISRATIAELDAVLSRKKFDTYVTPEERVQFLAMIVSHATVVEIVSTIAACRDSRDDKFLELAVDGRADCVITGDQDLLALDPFRGIRIATPADFLRSVSNC